MKCFKPSKDCIQFCWNFINRWTIALALRTALCMLNLVRFFIFYASVLVDSNLRGSTEVAMHGIKINWLHHSVFWRVHVLPSTEGWECSNFLCLCFVSFKSGHINLKNTHIPLKKVICLHQFISKCYIFFLIEIRRRNGFSQ